MIQSIEILLNTLETERYVRGPLLLDVLDELDRDNASAEARDLARTMLLDIEAGSLHDDEFSGSVARLRQLVHPSHAA